MYYHFLCCSYIKYILELEGSAGGLLKTFTASPAPRPLVIVETVGVAMTVFIYASTIAISF
jgi:hypothetical protein